MWFRVWALPDVQKTQKIINHVFLPQIALVSIFKSLFFLEIYKLDFYIFSPRRAKALNPMLNYPFELCNHSNYAPYQVIEAETATKSPTKIKEGNKERIQFFKGLVIQRKGVGSTETFTIRKMSGTVGVERIFPVNLPALQKIEVNKRGKVRRARIFYFRGLTGKKARIKERRIK